MNKPSPAQTPANLIAAASQKLKIARQVEKQHNREVGHMLKTASLHRPSITRSVPHVRGR